MDSIDNECSYLTDKDLLDKMGVLSSMQEECIQRAYVLGLKHILLLAKFYIQTEIEKENKYIHSLYEDNDKYSYENLLNSQGKIEGFETSLEIIEHIFNGDNCG
jgi:hypothetical protein